MISLLIYMTYMVTQLSARPIRTPRFRSGLTLALSDRPPRSQARGQRKLNEALAARRNEACHGPLERVVRAAQPNSPVAAGGETLPTPERSLILHGK